MINSDEFSKRLQKVIDYYSESASSFSEKIGVQRSSISHILSGRNKPSLDFVLKILSSYPEVELYWLLNGKGEFPSHSTPILQSQEKPKEKAPEETPLPRIDTADKSIEKIVIFYTDGTFKDFVKD
ncbi:helix-turn-helix domain-containing protein [Gelidibacter salicanalis]|uniref:Helix-turn-helix transcriptional regulator n=1 Tax=Gelidibacter salicanalis TaxID=291193 RepID=A0A934NJJ4_9FLAO|nr:helix-turn-helix transcriptional regulator [Gelidibacter salicanalis]MBJ7882688.1 helix-turn-helix transcriptional regulator [Gelidibacter salicanalis]